MSMDPEGLQALPCSVPSAWKDSPRPEIYRAEDNHSALEKSSAEMPPHTDTDMLVQNIPDSSTNPRVQLPISTEESSGKEEEGVKVQAKRQKMRTVFSQTQLCVLNARFQEQRYLTLQQMQELSSLLNLSYKQVKTWFQNKRMKHKRWEKDIWSKNSRSSYVIEGPASVQYPSLHGCLVDTSGNLPACNQTSSKSHFWDNQPWSSQTWEPPPLDWSSQPSGSFSWNQTASSQALSYPVSGSWGEEALQPCTQFQQNVPTSGLGITPESAGESLLNFGTPEAQDLFSNYSVPS